MKISAGILTALTAAVAIEAAIAAVSGTRGVSSVRKVLQHGNDDDIPADDVIESCFTIPDTQSDYATDMCIQDKDDDDSFNIFYRLPGTYYGRADNPNDYIIKYLCNCGGDQNLGFTTEFTEPTASNGNWNCFTRPGDKASTSAISKDFVTTGIPNTVDPDQLNYLCAKSAKG